MCFGPGIVGLITRRILEAFPTMAQELGLPLAEEKTEAPATSLLFLGIELDTRQQASRLPDDKLEAEFICY